VTVAFFTVRPDSVHLYRLSNVLGRDVTHRFNFESLAVANLAPHGFGDTDATGFGQRSEADGDIDAVAADLRAIDNNLAMIDTNSAILLPVNRDTNVPLDHQGLNLDRKVDGFIDNGNFENETSTGSANQPCAAARADREARFAMLFLYCKSPSLVGLEQTGKIGRFYGNNGG